MDWFDISGRKAIVTGGASGLAEGMAEGLLQAGAEVVIMDIAAGLPKLVQGFQAQGFKASGITVNIADRDQLPQAFEQALDMLGGQLDILIPAAGIQRRNRCEDFTLTDWDDVMNINLTAVFTICQLAGRTMLKQQFGKIINIASALSFFGGFTVPAYAASKGGVAQLTKALSNEWASQGINVNAIAPGYMKTKMNDGILSDAQRYESITSRIPAKRWGEPDDLKGVVVFLASHASDYINGAIIPVDGGYLGF
ncbi:MAG: SDR family oxidoreductase [Anaerolineales bacterium]|nr:MAG: SDR family oxidoreductase [Anaerolineales bacterium]